MYYAVECQDYAFYPDGGTPDARLTAWVDGAETAGINGTRLETGYYGDVPCLYWPTARTTTERPAPIVDPPYPGLRPDLDHRSGDADRERHAHLLAARRRLLLPGRRRAARHLRVGRGLPRRPDDGLAREPDPAADPGHDLHLGPVPTRTRAIAPTTAAGYTDALALASSVDDQIFNTYDYHLLRQRAR